MTRRVHTPHFIESDNAGREFGYPANMSHIVLAQIGCQSRPGDDTSEFIEKLKSLASEEDGPQFFERCHGITYGVHEDIFLGYWTDPKSYSRWASRSLAPWWESLPASGDTGYWREIMMPAAEHIAGIFFGIDRPEKLVGVTNLVGADPTDRWGYWGGYRDRLQASANDSFDPEVSGRYEPRAIDSRGRGLAITIPNNLLFVREGQEWAHVTDEVERRSWDDDVEPALDKWVGYLAQNPALSGALVMRDLIEQDVQTGTDTEKRSQLVYFQSLRHLERAARTQPSHVGLYNSYMKMLGEVSQVGASPALMIWVEQMMLKDGHFIADYINCDPKVGLLPWFESTEIIGPSPSLDSSNVFSVEGTQ